MNAKEAALDVLAKEAERLLSLRAQLDEQIERIQASIDYYESGTEARTARTAAREAPPRHEPRYEPPPKVSRKRHQSRQTVFTPQRSAFIRANFLDLDNTQLRLAANRMPGPRPIPDNQQISWWLSANGLKRGLQFTPERTQFILENHQRMNNGELRRACNEMPGPRIKNNQAISNILWKHDIRRSEGANPFLKQPEMPVGEEGMMVEETES